MAEVRKITRENLDILNAGFSELVNNSESAAGSDLLSRANNIVEDDRTYLFVAIIENSIVGYALAYRFPSLYSAGSLAYLYDIEVSQNHRRKGVGHLLIKKMLTDLKANRVYELWLGTATDNTAGQALFGSTGAEKSEEVFNDYTYILDK